MHSYDFRCKDCRTRYTLHVRSYADYDALVPTCPQCGSTQASRLIGKVAVKAPSRDYTSLSVNEMVSVFDSGDSRQVGQMFQQFGEKYGGGLSPEQALPYQETAKRLLDGESLDKVERDLSANPPPPPTAPASGSEG
jgi:putative FmdB family regulatory protein